MAQQNNNNLSEEDQIRLAKFQDICRIYEINNTFALRLRNLEGFEIVVIADDSGSMNTPVAIPGSDPFGKLPSRWDELKHTVSIITDIAAVMDHDGIDVHFLNRGTLINVAHHSRLDEAFMTKAEGGTPIVPILRKVLSTKTEKRRLIIIATDGCPDDFLGVDGSIVDGKVAFRYVLEKERAVTDYVTIVACTDDDNVMSYLNGWDKELDRVDVVDDYHSEKGEIVAVQGPQFVFSFGDYVVKALMGAVDTWFDKLDEICITGYTQINRSNSSNVAVASSYSNSSNLAAANNHNSPYKKNKKGCIIS